MLPRWVVVVAAAALTAATFASCDRSGASEEVVTYGASDATGEEATAAPDAPPAASPHAHLVPADEAPRAAGRPEPPQTSTPSPAAEDDTATFASQARLGAGQLARVLLQPTPARRLVVEVLEQPGAAARAGTVQHLTETLGAVSRKQVIDGGRWSIPDARRQWSATAINEVADDLARNEHQPDLAVIRVLFLRGSFDQGKSVLGVATRADTIAVFVDRAAAASTALVGRDEIEAAVAAHELGHLLGLVDLVVDTRRADPEHPGHSRNRESVMYWAVESGLVTQVLSGGPPRHFDDDDLADLASIRNGA